MNTPTAILKLNMLEFWHPGTGRGTATSVDNKAHRDKDGLPELPGKTVKGLLRDALWFKLDPMNALEGNPPELVAQLFGSEGGGLDAEGAVRVSSARLPLELREVFLKNPELVNGLSTVLHNTALDPDSGTAKNKTLRSTEVFAPLPLYAELELVGELPKTIKDWNAYIDLMKTCLPALYKAGLRRNRGLGRFEVDLTKHA